MKPTIICCFFTRINFVIGNPENHHQEPAPTDFKKLFQEWDSFESIRKSHLKPNIFFPRHSAYF